MRDAALTSGMRTINDVALRWSPPSSAGREGGSGGGTVSAIVIFATTSYGQIQDSKYFPSSSYSQSFLPPSLSCRENIQVRTRRVHFAQCKGKILPEVRGDAKWRDARVVLILATDKW